MSKQVNNSTIDMTTGGISEVSSNLNKEPYFDCDDVNVVNHYYGQIKKISADDDISSLTRGSVYYLRDNMNDINSAIHPYIIIQSTYVDKIGKISVFGITSTPSTIDMVPIIMDNAIGYINPNRIYTYYIDAFKHSSSRLKANIVNTTAFNIALDLYGMQLGMNLNKSNEEIISNYIEYVNEFKERAKHIQAYKPKTITAGPINKLELHTSYELNPADIDTNDTEIKMPDNDDNDSMSSVTAEYTESADTKVMHFGTTVQTPETTKVSRKRLSPEALEEAVRLYQKGTYSLEIITRLTGVSRSSLYNEVKRRGETPSRRNKNKKHIITVDVNNEKIKKMISDIENAPSGSVRLPRSIDKMTDEEKTMFMTFDFLYGTEMVSLAYNCNYKTALNRKTQISEKYDVIYKT